MRANELHDKVLYADAEMNKADWLTATAGMLGVVGIAFGLWWTDATAATFISFEIARDGWRNLGRAVSVISWTPGLGWSTVPRATL